MKHFFKLCSHFSNLTVYTEISSKLKCLIKNQFLNWFESSYILHANLKNRELLKHMAPIIVLQSFWLGWTDVTAED